MTEDWPEIEQLMDLALYELQLAKRFAAIDTPEAYEIAQMHVANANSYIKRLNNELPLSNEQESEPVETTEVR